MTSLSLYAADPGGHRLWYLSLLTDHALAQGWHVRVVTSRAVIDAPEWRANMSRGNFEIEIVSGRLRHLRALLRARRSDVIAVPDADRLLAWLVVPTVLGRRQWHVLLLRARSGQTPLALVIKRVLARVLAVRGVDVLELVQTSAAYDGRHRPLVEVTPTSSFMGSAVEARGALDLPARSLLLVCLGDVSPRKCVREIVEAWAEAAPPDAVLVLAGRFSSLADLEASELYQRLCASGSVVSRDGFLSEEDLSAYVRAADALLCVHRNSGSSGILARGLNEGKTVLVSEETASHLTTHPLVRATAIDHEGLVQALSELVLSLKPQVEARPQPSTRGDEFRFAADFFEYASGHA